MYTRKGDDQQASYRLCNLNPLHPILCALFIFIHIIDCGYSVESFNDAHEKNVILQLILEDHWSCSSPERLSHCKLMRFKFIENPPMKVYAWTLLTPGAWPNLTQGHDWHNL